MSFNINSDKEFVRGSKPKLIGDNELTIRGGTGSDEKEILRTQLDANTSIPRVGINRTGERVNNIEITSGGTGYVSPPTVTVDPPGTSNGVQAQASAFIFNGRVVNIAVNNPGKGYTSAPNVSFSSPQGGGAAATAFLDTVDYELDINGAIRTSTSIISDTARILNLDIDNFITPDLNLRGPNLKTYMNGTGTLWTSGVIVQKDSYRYFGSNVYQAINGGQTGPEAPEHQDGIVLNGEVNFKHIGFRVNDQNAYAFGETGEAGEFPRSITPLLGDRTDKIATTEYVLNLATNDVGGRIYVSEQIGSDLNDGRSAVNPVRTIKKAAQLAWTTPGVKETIIVSGGDYLEDNPISLPPDCSIVGDNLRLVIIRPKNPGKHIVKFGDKNYVIGVTYRDQIDANGDPVATWDFAMVFDDKQRVLLDYEVNGDFGVEFPVGHQIFGPDQFRVNFQQNTGLSSLQTGLEVVGVNTGARANVIGVAFNTTTGPQAYITGSADVQLTSGSFVEGEQFRYLTSASAGNSVSLTITKTAGENKFVINSNPSGIIAGGSYLFLDDADNSSFTSGYYEVANITPDDENAPTEWTVTVVPILGSPSWATTQNETISIFDATVVSYTFDTTSLISIRAEGEVVEVEEDTAVTLPIQRLDFSQQGTFTNAFQNEQFGNAEDAGGIVFYTNELVGRSNIHNFKEGQEVFIQGLPSNNSPDISMLNGYQRIYKVLEDADGRCRRFVIPKKIPGITDANFDPGQLATVGTYTRSVTLSLLNTPNKFPLSTPVERRFQDSCVFIRNNREFIADEVVGRINEEYAQDYHSVFEIGGQASASYTPTGSTYNPATGDCTFTINGHGLEVGDGIRIGDESITYTCDMDGNVTEHSLPEPTQYASGKSLPITSKTTNTITVNVTASGPDVQFTPSGADYNPATGELEITIGSHSLDVGEGITIDDNSLSFTCAMDNNQSVKTYPRPGIDPMAQRSRPITAVSATSITVNIGASPANQQWTPSDATYDPNTGDLVLTVGQHGLGVARNITLADSSLTFTCTKDGNTLQQSYPRPGLDPYNGQKSIAITAVGSTQHTVTNAPYDASTGVITFTLATHGFATGDYIKIADDSLTYTCVLDSNASQHTYPRAGFDRASNRWLEITKIDDNTFSVNVGTSSYTGSHTFVSAGANGIERQDGTFTVNVGQSPAGERYDHTFVGASTNAVQFNPQSAHTFTGATSNAVKHLPQSTHTFVRATAGSITTGGSSFKIYLGPTEHPHAYVSGGTVEFGGNPYAITNFSYDSEGTGVATVTTAGAIPGLAEDNIVKLADILISCDAGQKLYPAYSSPTSGNNVGSNGDEQCRQDVIHFLNALVRDLEFGSNHNVLEASRKYIINDKVTYIEDEIAQNVRAIEYARELATYAMRNWRAEEGTPSDPQYVPRYSSVARYFDNTVITSTAQNGQGVACADVASAIDTLTYLWINVITNNQNGTYKDAAYLISRNLDVIADETYKLTKVAYPSLGHDNIQERKCTRDTKYVLKALIKDLTLGGNSGVLAAAESYYTNTNLTGVPLSELGAVRYAYTVARDLATKAMRNWSDSGNIVASQPTNAQYNVNSGELILTIPTSNLPNPFSASSNCRVGFQLGALTFNCAYNGGGDHSSPQILDTKTKASYPVLNYNASGGISTITLNVGTPVTNSDAHTFVSAAAGGTLFVNDYATLSSDIPRYEDYTVGTDYPNTPLCAGVKSAIDTSFQLLDDVLEYAVDSNTGTEPGTTTYTYGTPYDIAPIITYPDSFVYDLNNNRMAVRGDFDDNPIIEASPYTQNSSVISFLGGGGALVDGAKVKQPNCPFPGLELDGSASFPNQGKSMVASAFTIVSFGGTGYKVINDGYTQLVSVFVIFCADGVLAESGGYCSITNSATNFGVYALRGIGFRDEPYDFDIGTITNVSATPTGRTILTVDGLGREPLEHYVVKVRDNSGNPYTNTNPDIEYFIDAVGAVGAGPPFSAELTIDDGQGQGMNLTNFSGSNGQTPNTGDTLRLHRPSIVNSSSHTWEFAGSGTNYLALPENGGVKVEAHEQVSEDYGRVYVSGTDELGDFKVGTFARIENRTGNITFTGTVTISEVEFLKLKGGDVVVTGFSADDTLGGASSSDSILPTQKSVKSYITNNLGPYINRPYGTNAVPNQLVQLTESGKISLDQIPALRPFEVYTVADQTERLAIEGALAGDIAIQQDTSTSFILNNDLDSLFLAFNPDPTVQFTLGDIFTGSISTGRLQATEYRQGVVYTINLDSGGSGYTSAPNVTISGTLQQGGVEARAETTIANGEVVTITIVDYNGYRGGKGYTSAPTVTIAAPAGSGTQAQATPLIESRLYGNIVNKISITDTDTFDSSDIPAVTININRVVNTSANDNNNWVSLSSNQIAATDITSGVIETDRLASGGTANSFTFLRGDQNYALTVQSMKGAEVRYFAKLYSGASSGSNQLIFQTNSDVLIGHEVKNTVTGIQANTNITGVITAAGLTTVSINNPLSQNVSAGTIIEFERGASPMVFESTYTQGNFVDDIIISNGGLGFTNGQYFDVEILGGAGTGLKTNIIVSGNTVSDIVVTDGGTGYTSDFTVTIPPSVIGGGSSMVLEVKTSTVNRQYANVAIDIARVSDLTISSDLYGTIGVARYKKSQFNIGVAGNGSLELKTGPNSGLDADLLDTKQGSFYTNATNLFTGTVPTDRLAGSYNITISGSSGNTLRLSTGTNNPTSNPTPNNFVEGLTANTINNTADLLQDGGTQHLVLTIRNKGQGLTAEGGVRQMAFTDNDNIWMRGSGTGVTSFGSWGKMWTSLNDGIGSGLDADRLDNKQGLWYQNALNVNKGTLSEQVLPRWIEATAFRDHLTIKSYNGDLRLQVYISGQILTSTPFTPGSLVKFYDDQAQAAGDFQIDTIQVNDDTSDDFNDYSILIGRLTSGNITTVNNAVTIGTASNRVVFDEWSLEEGNTIDVAKLESDGGTANLRLGRSDGNATTPGIYFNSSQVAANYNSALVASGGSISDGSGTLNVIVNNNDSFTVKSNVVWNAGNVAFNSSNVASTASLKSAVMRDTSGNFSAGTITANLSGSASLNVLKTGDTMTGPLNIVGNGANLSVSGTTGLTGVVTMSNDLSVDSGTFFVDASANEVGINVGSNPLSTLDVSGDTGIFVRTTTNAAGARIKFTDASDRSQIGQIQYFHSDGTVGSYNEVFKIVGSETLLGFEVTGDILATRRIGINKNNPDRALDVSGSIRLTSTLNFTNTGSGTTEYYTNSSTRYWKTGSNSYQNNFFTFEASNSAGSTTFSGSPALSIDGVNNAIAINTTSTSGNDPDTSVFRQYQFNCQGDMNINGQLFQNNAPFVTSRWTLTNNQTDIYRGTKVGINRSNNTDLTYDLDVEGSIGLTGFFYANGIKQWQDSKGVIKSSSTTISENVTIDGNTSATSAGNIVITSGYSVVVPSTSTWTIV